MTRVLVVEDEAVIGRDIATMLTDLGYEVPEIVASGERATSAVARTHPDLVLLDIKLRGAVDGISVGASLREMGGPPFIYLTSYSDDNTLARAKSTGAYGYVLKPFNERDLQVAIEVALEKHKIEVELARKDRWFATTLRSVGDAVIATDAAQRIKFMNPVAEKLTGFSEHAVRGQHISKVFALVDPVTGAPIECPVGHALRDGFAVSLPQAGQLKNARQRSLIDDSAAPIIDETGQTLGAVLVFRDVTERRQLEQRLTHSEKLASLGTLAAGMAHEINNPLTYVHANVRFALDELDRLDLDAVAKSPQGAATVARLREVRQVLEEAAQGSERIRLIVRDLSRFSRVEGQERTLVELSTVLDAALRISEHAVRHHGAVVRTYGTTPYVDGNEGQLEQVFINLIVNASHALADSARSDGRIVITTSTDELGRAVVAISDNGSGMTDDVRRRIFEPFFTTKPSGEGTGLGLAICQSIVRAHGGTISVESAVGAGTTFRVALPAVARLPRAASAHGETEPTAKRGRILVVDDEAAIRRALVRTLERDHDVVDAASGTQALALLREGPPFDLVLCDLMMATMTGVELYEHILAEMPAMAKRFVFITGGAVTPRTEDFIQTTTNTVLYKPLDSEELRNVVADYMPRAS